MLVFIEYYAEFYHPKQSRFERYRGGCGRVGAFGLEYFSALEYQPHQKKPAAAFFRKKRSGS